MTRSARHDPYEPPDVFAEAARQNRRGCLATALVAGAVWGLSFGITWQIYTTAVVARAAHAELFAALWYVVGPIISLVPAGATATVFWHVPAKKGRWFWTVVTATAALGGTAALLWLVNRPAFG